MTRIQFDIRGMHCASCVARVERALADQPGVRRVRVNLATEQASVELDPSSAGVDELAAAVRRAGYEAAPIRIGEPEDAAASGVARETAQWRRRLIFALSLLTLLLAAGWAPGAPSGAARWLRFILGTAVQCYVGGPYFAAAWRQLKSWSVSMDTLVALGTGAAYAAGVAGLAFGASGLTFADSAMILTFITLGKYLEQKAKGRASRAIRRLMELAPPRALVLRGSQSQAVPIEEVVVGEEILVRPGDKTPLDAVVLSGQSEVNEAWLTGESMPVEKGPGDRILAGAINGGGALRAKVQRAAGQTALAQVIELVRAAQESKAEVQRLADRVVAWFVPAVLAIAAATLLGWIALASDARTGLACSVAVLVAACPCALGLATPVAVLVGGGRGAEHGILIKHAHSLEIAGRVDTVVFDKTGTVTTGRPEIVEVLPAEGVAPDDLIGSVAAAERQSSHPLGAAVLDLAARRAVTTLVAEGGAVAPGEGIEATLDGQRLLVGNERLLERNGVPLPPSIGQRLARERTQGRTPLLAARGHRWLGALLAADRVAEGSAETVRQLRKMGMRLIMLSGDQASTAETIAREVGVTEVIADVPPDKKQGAVDRLRREGRTVAMVGDGINDAPALAAADLGIALGSGADVAIESADIVLVQRDLRGVARAIRLSRSTLRTIRQNLAWAFLYNICLLPLAAGLFVPFGGLRLSPPLAAAAMAASSVSVVLNSLRLRRKKID